MKALPTNQGFSRLLDELSKQGGAAAVKPSSNPIYREFIAKFPLSRIENLRLDEYCVGKSDNNSFCWWIERGLEPVLGRYMPGTARGHLMYFDREGRLYKNRDLADLDDDEALKCVLRLHSTIAAASPDEDLTWLDDDRAIQARAGLARRVSVSGGRKLRLLSCYHPDDVPPISSADHLSHFLEALGCPYGDVPDGAIARMLKLKAYYLEAEKTLPGLSVSGFMRALYSESLGIAPVRVVRTESSASSEEAPEESREMTMDNVTPPLNQILFGPPGTGKTHATVDKALEVLAPEFLAVHRGDRKALKTRFDELAAAGHVRFVTFHQSFSYEDFVEGLRATTDEDGTLRYEVVDGVFKNLCEAAVAKVTQQAEAPIDLAGRRVWKMSLGNSQGSDAYIFDECIAKGYALLGYGELTDFSDCKDRDDVLKRFLDDGHTVTRDSYAVTAVSTFLLKMKVGDLLVVSEGNSKFRAIGEVTGDYEAITREAENDEYGQCRKVKWLRVYKPALPGDQLMNNQFSQMTLYELRSGAIDMEKLAGLLHSAQRAVAVAPLAAFQVGELFGGYRVAEASGEVVEVTKPNGNRVPFGMSLLRALAEHVRSGRITVEDIKDRKALEKLPKTDLEPYLVNGYSGILAPLVERLLGAGPHSQQSAEESVRDAKVLIIDEINRGNVSRVFGELITLIESSKRAGHDEALEVTLPYSKQRFSVPDNVFLIGTMNTADRSLAALDIALRRRFSFVEMPPRPDLLDEVDVQGVNIGQLLRAMNERIEVLLDRDHCLGHAYFMPLTEDPTLPRLAAIFRANILPLLQEYFFEDWQRIQWVLNDHRKSHETLRFLSEPKDNLAALFGDNGDVRATGRRWRINDKAFEQIGAYAEIIPVPSKPN